MVSKKKGKRKPLISAQGFGAKNFSSELQKAEAMLAREEWEEAIALLQPLSSLILYHRMWGQPAEAKAMAERLKTVESDAWNLWVKQVEGMARLRH